MYRSLCLGVVLWLIAQSAQAHPEYTVFDNFSQGLLHPLTGMDHLLVLLTVGILATRAGDRRQWCQPLVFIVLLVLGGWLGFTRLPLPATEPLIAISVIVTALWVLLRVKQFGAIRLSFMGMFALAHGYAHGAEMELNSLPYWYGLGFILSSTTLLLGGWAVGKLAERQRINLQPVMLAIAGTGVYWLLSG
jgi:urease accessory protein